MDSAVFNLETSGGFTRPLACSVIRL